MTAAAPVPVVLCIDAEPDKRQVTRDGGDWDGLRPTAAAVERWRTRLAAVTAAPVHLSWFWRTDPQIAASRGDAAWALREFRDLIDATTARGDAHGIHPHTWRRQQGTDQWIQDGVDPQWVRTCIDTSIDAFEEAMGQPCELVRMGDRALNLGCYRRLTERGVRIDLSVEPGAPPLNLETVEPGPDFTTAPTRPYRPGRHDIATRGHFRRGPVLLPLSAIVAPSAGSDATRLRTVYLWMAEASELVNRLLAESAPYLAFAIRSDLALRPDLSERFERTLTTLAGHERARSLRFVTPQEAVTLLRRRPLGNFRPPR